jgi:XRCC1 N terminal domain
MMRKRPITTTQEPLLAHDERWIDIEATAVVEVSSEEKDFPIDSALLPGEGKGWRAAKPGTQTVRLMFDKPQKLRRIVLVFEENDIQRTQEFVLRWSPDGGHSFREIVRQQWNFSPPDSVREVQEYQVELTGVTVLELIITPEISGGTARASLKSFRVA